MNIQDLVTPKEASKKKDDKKMLAVKLDPKIREKVSTFCKSNKIKQAKFITACINDGIAKFEELRKKAKEQKAA